jgi:nucleoside-diphosphate-sugar epimerase
MMNNKNVLITGGAGFIGSNLARKLVDENYTVTILDNLFRGSYENIEDLIFGDNKFHDIDLVPSSSINEMAKILESTKPTLILHYAAINGTEYFYDIPAVVSVTNSISTYNLMEAVKTVKSKSQNWSPKVVFASTSELYGDPEVIPTPEESKTVVRISEDRDSYAAGKLMSEFYVKLYCKQLEIDYLIFRIFNVYGPGMIGTKYGQVIPEFISRLKAGEYPLNIYGDGKHTRSFCYIKDHVELSMKVINSKKENLVVNLGNDHEVSIHDLANKIMMSLEIKPSLNCLPSRQGDHLRRCPDLNLLKSIVGEYEYHTLEDGIRLCI